MRVISDEYAVLNYEMTRVCKFESVQFVHNTAQSRLIPSPGVCVRSPAHPLAGAL